MHCKKPVARLNCVGLLILSLFGAGQKEAAEQEKQPKITGVRFISFPKAKQDGSVEFELAIEGENLPTSKTGVSILFETKDPAHPVTCKPQPCVPDDGSDDKETLVKGMADAGTDVTRIRIIQTVEKVSKTVADTKKDFLISIKENPPKPVIDQFEIKLEPETNKEFPNLHGLVVTKVGGEPNVGFADNRHLMTVDLMPGGATDLNIVQTNRERLDVHYVAAADYKPTSAVITVYNSTDLDTRRPIAVAVSKKETEDPNKPKVTRTEIVFINRSHGVGRIRIFGEKFGEYKPPPYQVDDYLWNCLEEFRIRGTDRYATRIQQLEFDDLMQRIEACRQMLGGKIDTEIREKEKAGERALGLIPEETPAKGSVPGAKQKDNNAGKRKIKKNIEVKDEPELKKQIESTKTNLATFITDVKEEKDALQWADGIRQKVAISIHSRNPDIEVQKVDILNINDKMIDVYFEFTRYRGFSYPVRLESSTLTIKKTVQKTTQTVKDDKLTATITGAKEETYDVDYQIEPKRDPNLTYKYTILDDHAANTLLGKGVADNFYVIQLSVVNNAEKKVSIPLASIQAEVEWIRGEGHEKKRWPWPIVKEKEKKAIVAFGQGPATVAPVPLAAVSSNFEAYQKAKGFRAHLFNGLEATTTIATALVPVTGPSLKDAEVFFSGGFVPGVHKALGDLSSQQLQNLTSLSWESSETVPAKGGSIEKLIYIEKGSQQFKAKKQLNAYAVPDVRTSQIASILGLEVTGFEVTESSAKPATPATEKPPEAGNKPADETGNKPEGDQKEKKPGGETKPSTPPSKKPAGKAQ